MYVHVLVQVHVQYLLYFIARALAKPIGYARPEVGDFLYILVEPS